MGRVDAARTLFQEFDSHGDAQATRCQALG